MLRVVVAVLAFGLATIGGPMTVDAGIDDPVPPPVTVNEFLPEDRDLSDCFSALPKPGCGSEARGGWSQWVVLGAILSGLGVIGWRISVGVRQSRPPQVTDDARPEPRADRDRTPPSR